MVNSDISEAIKRDHAYVIQTWFEPPHWQFWVYHPGGDKELIKEGDGKFGPSWISRYSESGPDAEYALLLANKAVMKSLQRKMKSLRAEAKASFSHWLWLILIASIRWLSLAARASDKQPKPKPNPTPFPTPAITFMPTPTETHAPTSTVNDSGGQVFNVKTYGAVGNGSTDDTAAIRSAITAASATGGIVFFPPGICLTQPTYLQIIKQCIISGLW